MNLFWQCVYCELIKMFKSKIFLITMIASAFIPMMIALVVYVSIHPELVSGSSILSAKASMLKAINWAGYMGLMNQMIAILGIIGFGFITSWVFGREYIDHTLKDMLSLPISRITIVLSKSAVILMWSLLLTALLFAFSIIGGILIRMPGALHTELAVFASVFFKTAFFTFLLYTPIMMFASISRGYLLPLGVMIFVVMITQIVAAALPGLARFIPWAVPALLSGAAGPQMQHIGFVGYILFFLTIITGFAGTCFWWILSDQR